MLGPGSDGLTTLSHGHRCHCCHPRWAGGVVIQSVACPSSPGQPSPRQRATHQEPAQAVSVPASRETEAQPEHLSPNSHRPGGSESGLGQEGSQERGNVGSQSFPMTVRRASTPSLGPPSNEASLAWKDSQGEIASGPGDMGWRTGWTGAATGRATGAHAWSTVDRHPAATPGGTQTREGCLSRCPCRRPEPGQR